MFQYSYTAYERRILQYQWAVFRPASRLPPADWADRRRSSACPSRAGRQRGLTWGWWTQLHMTHTSIQSAHTLTYPMKCQSQFNFLEDATDDMISGHPCHSSDTHNPLRSSQLRRRWTVHMELAASTATKLSTIILVPAWTKKTKNWTVCQSISSFLKSGRTLTSSIHRHQPTAICPLHCATVNLNPLVKVGLQRWGNSTSLPLPPSPSPPP